MNEYRHVCFKDLEKYRRKDDYFENLTKNEILLIRENLGISNNGFDSDEYNSIVYGTYDEINRRVKSNALELTNRYIITDFQTIYKSNTGEVWGLSNHPSKKYSIILTPVSSNTFDQRVILLEDNEPLNWEVYYDFTQEIIDGIPTKGKITYLRDSNNNSAYYDFKNILFRIKLRSSEVTSLLQDSDIDLYTFSKPTSNPYVYEDNSDSPNVINNQFDKDCYENVFLGDITNNNHFYGGFKKNLFLKNCQYNKFEWNTTNNIFTESVTYTSGSIENALMNVSYDSAVSKELKMLYTLQESEPIFVLTFFDGDTLTNQVIKLMKV